MNDIFLIFKYRLIFPLTFLIIALKGFTSTGVVQITLEIREGDKPLTNQEVRISKMVRFTDPVYGRIVIEVPSDQPLFVVEIPGKVITIPQGGVVYKRTDPSEIIIILTGSSLELKTFTEINRKLEGMALNITNIGELVSKSQAFIVDYLKKNNVELEQYKIQQFLEIQKEKEFYREGQLKTIPLLTSSLDQYISRTKDLCDELDQSVDKVFNDNGAIIQKLNLRISFYNQAYEELNKNRESIINYVENYWGEGSLYDETRRLLNEALRDIHQLEILLSNNLINDINNYNEQRKGRREKAEIKNDIKNTTNRVNLMIQNLDNDKTRLVEKLKAYYPNNMGIT
jgi:hypothetical protein